MKVVTRFAPSPTGNLHIGGARTALFNYLFTKKNGGTFLLRIEDTDKARSTKEFEKNILEGLDWLGLSYDNKDKPYRQSERTEIYKKAIQKLIDSGHAYISKETPKEEGDRDEVIRFKNPKSKVKFTDLIRGEIEVDTTDLGDFIIAKSLEEPVFHLTNVVDDIEMGMTHIIRGEDHISNTPRQILIWEALGAPRAIYAHIPLILAPDRSKLSKRHGAVSLIEYKEKGYLPEALLNFLALLGWNPGTEKEIFNLEGLVEAFDINKVQKGGAIFNEEKLKWVNKEHIKLSDKNKIISLVKERLEKKSSETPENFIYSKGEDKFMDMIIERISTFAEIDEMINIGELKYFTEKPELDTSKIVWKKDTKENCVKHLSAVISILEKLDEKNIDGTNWTAENIKGSLFEYAEKEGRGNVLWPIRYSLSGKDKSPDPFTIMEILGKEEALERIKDAIKMLS